MPNAHELGAINLKQGICGFTSTLYAVYENRASMRVKLDAVGKDASTRLMAEIKTFLVIMKAQGKQSILDDIQELTRSFAGYEQWTPDKYIQLINSAARPVGVATPNIKFSIAMPPGALIEYLHTVWEFNAVLESSLTDQAGNSILGLTRTGAPKNRFNNLAHYVYVNPHKKVMSWGEEFSNLADLNSKKGRDYSVVYRISLK